MQGDGKASADFAEVAGSRPASREGKLVLTTAPWSPDRGDGNTRRFPLWSAEDGVPREARKRCALPCPFPHPSGANLISFTSPKPDNNLGKVSPGPTATIVRRSKWKCFLAAAKMSSFDKAITRARNC